MGKLTPDCLFSLGEQNLDRLALATIEDNNGEIARTICGMIFLPAVSDSSLLPRFWRNLEQPWYRQGPGGGSDQLGEAHQRKHVLTAVEFLDHLERQGEDHDRWAPVVVLMIGACQAVQARNDMMYSIAAELLKENLHTRGWWKVYEQYWEKGYSRQMERCIASTWTREMPPWDEIVREEAAEEASDKKG